jgi:hypothetical protein
VKSQSAARPEIVASRTREKLHLQVQKLGENMTCRSMESGEIVEM